MSFILNVLANVSTLWIYEVGDCYIGLAPMVAMEILGGSLLPTSEMDKGRDGSFNSTKSFSLHNADSTILGYSKAS